MPTSLPRNVLAARRTPTRIDVRRGAGRDAIGAVMARVLAGGARLAWLAVPVLLSAMAMVGTAPASAAPAGAAGSSTTHGVGTEEPVEREVHLARLGFRNGVQVVFSRDETSGDFGLREDGQIDRNGPVVDDRVQSLLVAYLRITPKSVPVPQQLLAELPPGTPTPPELAGRTFSSSLVVADDLAVPTQIAATMTCWDPYYDPYHWFDLPGYPNPGTVFHGDKTYYSSSFGGMAMYSRSYLANCGGYARHRIYYKDFGVYKKHHDAEIAYWHWQAVKKGSVHRYRKVHYDGTWGDTRNGKYTG